MTEDVKIKISSEVNTQGFEKLKSSLNGVSSSFKKVETDLSSTSKAFSGFAGGFAAGIAALVTGSMATFVTKSIRMGAELKVLRDSFQGTVSDLELFKKATAGTVSEGSLIKLSNYASDLGVNLKDQAKLFSLAEDAADKYGGGVESNFERVINAADGSARGLRAVGISTKDFEQEMKKLVATTGKHLDSMTAEEQQQIRLQAIFNLTGTTIEKVSEKTQDAADMFDSLGVKADEVTAAFGSSFVNAFNSGAEAMQGIGTSASILEGLMESLGKRAGETASSIANAFAGAMGWIDSLYGKYAPQDVKDQRSEFQKGQDRVRKRLDFLTAQDEEKKRKEELTKFAPINTGRGSKISKKEEDKIEKAKAFYSPGGGVFVFDTSGVVLPTKLIGGLTSEDIRQTGFQVESDSLKDVSANSRNALEDTNTMYGVVSSTMNLLGVSTDSFVGKLIGGFGTVLTIMEAIKTVNSIFSFLPIPGFASGGVLPAGVSLVGERGPELMFNPGAYVMNHNDSMRFINSNSQGSNVNVYLSGNIDVTATQRKENKKYRAITIRQ